MRDHVRFIRDLIDVRRQHAALRSDRISTYHVHDGNRVLACHRWTDAGDDVVVIATLREETWRALRSRLPASWPVARDVQQRRLRRLVRAASRGSGGRLDVAGPPRDGFAQSATVMIPANGLLVLAAAQI